MLLLEKSSRIEGLDTSRARESGLGPSCTGTVMLTGSRVTMVKLTLDGDDVGADRAHPPPLNHRQRRDRAVGGKRWGKSGMEGTGGEEHET